MIFGSNSISRASAKPLSPSHTRSYVGRAGTPETLVAFPISAAPSARPIAYPGKTDRTPFNSEKTASVHQKQPLANIAFSTWPLERSKAMVDMLFVSLVSVATDALGDETLRGLF